MTLRFIDLPSLSDPQRVEAARILRDAFAHMPNAFDGQFEAEVQSFWTEDDRAGFAALEGETVRGWIGRIATYSHAWELHPLVVDPAHQRRGIGRRLVQQLEVRARQAGVLTLYLGTDDDFGGTTIFGRRLFPNVAAHIADVAATERGHPVTYYRALGYEVVGLIPDANGEGKPDIFMAKRLP